MRHRSLPESARPRRCGGRIRSCGFLPVVDHFRAGSGHEPPVVPVAFGVEVENTPALRGLLNRVMAALARPTAAAPVRMHVGQVWLDHAMATDAQPRHPAALTWDALCGQA